MQRTSPGHESGAWDEHGSGKKQERLEVGSEGRDLGKG